jgi:hypothetical protein
MNQRIELTKYQFDHSELPFLANHVLIEMTQSNEGRKTKSGVIVGLTERLVYAAGDNSLAADLEECWGTVARVPEKLYFCETDPTSMSYETEMELEVNDQCWFSIIEAHNAIEILCEDKIYKLIPYEDLYCVKRADKVIVLNGYCLCQTVNKLKISELDVTSESKIDTTKCIVKYVGKANKRYKHPSYVDHPDIREGDLVLLQPRTSFQYLERKTYLSSFDGDNLYLVIPRRKICMVLNRQE